MQPITLSLGQTAATGRKSRLSFVLRSTLAAGALTATMAVYSPLNAQIQETDTGNPPVFKAVAQEADRFSVFRPTGDRIDHTID